MAEDGKVKESGERRRQMLVHYLLLFMIVIMFPLLVVTGSKGKEICQGNVMMSDDKRSNDVQGHHTGHRKMSKKLTHGRGACVRDHDSCVPCVHGNDDPLRRQDGLS
jgi:hypothetical protein